jgi:hypothetical protein
VSGDTASIAYMNQGSITDASGTTSQKWLESAFLQKQAGISKIVFMQQLLGPHLAETIRPELDQLETALIAELAEPQASERASHVAPTSLANMYRRIKASSAP